ncbi:bifunctional demethylmenaquinone methyltransferase/2-methoxy-6-polyprenyl-1,4-benzoquinol methylase UbiE [Brumimicrobium glaciale]|jgi:demethylmenaquinone methyltransferase/2-methoxy-6-polyprenyl-1,4-benzoquinol methylase|uniref:Demethylmenaquinone methyltransferase n=1 Tax=Brumimicrobium glaciale TaxID=200475 RepID=A0A4Q4KNP0_9FLAO|nr:bifunctional demethylmenaquinone methyltransferase/2-methoxy-6-polyprenyl-1,4-benzoquinol methylase UbiE [Brumimicrobium glaciale]RYM35025.1 bifunctional demethylmenaquinone methyltransferase/2-methoxy-6-polyprenyl-1,4-benzoquinol methylase UbiE [Brumimicrobium glaciale]
MSEKKVVKPYNKVDKSKKEEVAEMFDNISAKYDFLNHFMSLGIDHLWRKRAINMLKASKPKKIIDLATGTGDFALAALKLNPEKVVGVDISNGMLEKGREKMKKRGKEDIISMVYGDSEDLPFADNEFDALTVGFGVRNYENLEKGLAEMLRVINVGGTAVILEFSKPKKFPIKQFFGFYSKYVIPTLGKTISKDSSAYEYLPESVAAFPEGQDFLDILNKVGYKNTTARLVSGGIATIYTGVK